VVAATLVYAVERGGDGPIQTYPDALWWAAATVTTVGYGDVFPKTAAGRGIAFLLMLVGISVFGLLTARVAAIFVEANEEDHNGRKLDEVLARLERLEQQLRRSTGPEIEEQ
jgi:voltage-gated potassium channel